MKIELPNNEIYPVIADYARTKLKGAENLVAHVRVRHANTIVTFTEPTNGNANNGSGGAGVAVGQDPAAAVPTA